MDRMTVFLSFLGCVLLIVVGALNLIVGEDLAQMSLGGIEVVAGIVLVVWGISLRAHNKTSSAQ